MKTIAENLERIHEKITAAALRANRDPASIKLVAVSKTMPIERIEEAVSCGQLLFGENYIQEARDKIAALPPEIQKTVTWHFIGALQSNKARVAAAHFQVIETVDRLKLAQALNRSLEESGKQLSVLVQVNIGREPQKSGVLPENCAALLKDIATCRNLSVDGLMAIPPHADDPEETRPYFRELCRMAREYAGMGLFSRAGAPEISMGMSGDFEVAVEEGATLVRVGTAIFGSR